MRYLILFSLFISYQIYAKQTDKKILQALDIYAKVLKHVDNLYYREVNLEDFIYNSIKKGITSLDPHSEYFSQKEYDSFSNNLDDATYGVGLEFDIREDEVWITRVYKNSPAEKAGVPIGALIEQVDGKKTFGKDRDFIFNLLKGKVATEVKINYYYKERFRNVTLVRDKIEKDFIEIHHITDDVIYVKIDQFNKNLTSIFKQKLIRYANKSFIIDLRDNPGGYLDESINFADLFLEKGIIVSSKEKNKKEFFHRATKKTPFKNSRINILVNGETASASEIFAGAIKDNKRGFIIGLKTYGKGSIQSIIKILNGGALKLTVALYYTPNHSIIQGRGIMPHIILPKYFDLEQKSGESSLKGYIKVNNKNKKENIPDFLKKDRQFLTAFRMLVD